MANTIRIKRRSSAGSSGAPSSLENAELAYNEADDTLYYGKGTGGAGGSATTIEAIARIRLLRNKGNYSNRRVSNYSNWAEERMKKGLQVNYVDFSYTGGLLDALMVEYKEGKVRLVFETIEDEVVAEQLDRMYGLGVFELSEQEEELLKSEVADMSRDIINNTIKQIL